MKYNLSVIMKRAWEIKREDSRNIFGICLQMAWEEAKSNKKTVEEYLIEKGGKLWEKADKKRVYVNNLGEFLNDKCFRKCSMYYDVKADKFVFMGFTSSRTQYIDEIVSDIRKAC